MTDDVTKVPFPLLVCFFFGATIQSIPLVAFGLFLNEEIKMSFEEQARFYAFIFLPWSLKPLFSLVMELCGGRKTRVYFIFGSACLTALSTIVTAMYVDSVPTMYFVSFFRSFFEALGEYGLSLTLIDFIVDAKKVDKTQDVAARAQSQSTSARMFGSLLSSIFGLIFLYNCHSKAESLDPRTVIGLSSVFALITAAASCFLPRYQPPTEDLDGGDVMAIVQEGPNWKMYTGIVLFQLFFVWIGIHSSVNDLVWLIVFLIMLLLGLGALVRLYFTLSNREALYSGFLLFMLNATPGVEQVWFGFKLFALRSSSCYLQILTVFGQCTGFVACWVYPKLLAWIPTSEEASGKRRAFNLVALFTVISSLLGLVVQLALAVNWKELREMDLMLVTSLFAVTGVLGTFVGQFQMLSEQVFVTESSLHEEEKRLNNPMMSPGLAYGVFLSLWEFGDSASGWISSPIIGALAIEYQNYEQLWALVLISLLSPILVIVAFALFLRFQKRQSTPDAFLYEAAIETI